MLVEMNVQATPDEVRFVLPQFGASTIVKNCMAYRIDKKGSRWIVAVGEDADSLRDKTPVHLQGKLAELHFVHPFALDQFASEFIEVMIKWHLAFLQNDKRRTNWFCTLYVDRLLLTLSIADYERLPLEQRQEFEYGLQKSFTPKLRNLIVNGGSSFSPEFLQEKHQFERQHAIADWILWGLRAVGMFGPFLLVARLWPDLPVASDLTRTLMLLLAALASVALGDWLGLTIWGIVMPRITPVSTLQIVVAKSNLAKTEKKWLRKLLHEPKSGSTIS